MSNPEINWSEPHDPADFTAPKCSEPWQPIETAPYGEYVIVFCKGWDPTVAMSERIHVGTKYEQRGMWEVSQAGSYACDNYMDFEPTHWAPLPPFPETPQ